MTYKIDDNLKVVKTIGGVRDRGVHHRGHIVVTIFKITDSLGRKHDIPMYPGEPEKPGLERPWFIDPSNAKLFETAEQSYGAANSASPYTPTLMLPTPVYSNDRSLRVGSDTLGL